MQKKRNIIRISVFKYLKISIIVYAIVKFAIKNLIFLYFFINKYACFKIIIKYVYKK